MQRAALDRPVFDKTGLTGRYDFDLEFSSDVSVIGGRLPKAADSTKPGLFAAIQEQLGIKLGAMSGPVNSLFIDNIDRPWAN